MSSLIPPVLPIPGKLPAFDNTLGALFIGHTLASMSVLHAYVEFGIYSLRTIRLTRTYEQTIWHCLSPAIRLYNGTSYPDRPTLAKNPGLLPIVGSLSIFDSPVTY